MKLKVSGIVKEWYSREYRELFINPVYDSYTIDRKYWSDYVVVRVARGRGDLKIPSEDISFLRDTFKQELILPDKTIEITDRFSEDAITEKQKKAIRLIEANSNFCFRETTREEADKFIRKCVEFVRDYDTKMKVYEMIKYMDDSEGV